MHTLKQKTIRFQIDMQDIELDIFLTTRDNGKILQEILKEVKELNKKIDHQNDIMKNEIRMKWGSLK